MSKKLKPNERYFIGTMELDDHVDITDPMYGKSVWCRSTEDCQPGTYFGYVDTVDADDFGVRISRLSIFKDDKSVDFDDMDVICNIGVDSAMAGFFRDKKDFSDEEFEDLCELVDSGNYWNAFDGLFSTSGLGDGGYDVYANDERTAFTIEFL